MPGPSDLAGRLLKKGSRHLFIKYLGGTGDQNRTAVGPVKGRVAKQGMGQMDGSVRRWDWVEKETK